MKQIKVKNILALLDQLKKQGMSEKEIGELAVYIGDDEEMNGIHTAYYCQKIDEINDAEFVELIENGNNAKFNERALLIS